MPLMRKALNYYRKGVKLSNVASPQMRRMSYRVVITCLGSTYRWRVMSDETQKAAGICSSRKAAQAAAAAELKRWKATNAA